MIIVRNQRHKRLARRVQQNATKVQILQFQNQKRKIDNYNQKIEWYSNDANSRIHNDNRFELVDLTSMATDHRHTKHRLIAVLTDYHFSVSDSDRFISNLAARVECSVKR